MSHASFKTAKTSGALMVILLRSNPIAASLRLQSQTDWQRDKDFARQMFLKNNSSYPLCFQKNWTLSYLIIIKISEVFLAIHFPHFWICYKQSPFHFEICVSSLFQQWQNCWTCFNKSSEKLIQTFTNPWWNFLRHARIEILISFAEENFSDITLKHQLASYNKPGTARVGAAPKAQLKWGLCLTNPINQNFCYNLFPKNRIIQRWNHTKKFWTESAIFLKTQVGKRISCSCP